MRVPSSRAVVLVCLSTGLLFFSRACAPAAPVDPEISGAISAFSADPASLDLSFFRLFDQIRANPSELARAALQQLEVGDETVRFAAIFALANTAENREQVDGLRRVLSSQIAGERMLAAEALLARGEKEAIPILIAALNSAEDLIYSYPPRQAWQTASYLLLLYTLEDFGLSGADSFELVAATQPTWQAWWSQNGDRLQWDAERGVYQ